MAVGYNPKIVTNGLVLNFDAGNNKSFPLAPSYSNYFDGNGDNLTTVSSAAFNFGSGDFTVEAWFYPTALGRQHSLVDTRSTGTNGWVFYINTSNQLQYWDGSSTTSSTSTVSLNTWSHLVWCRSGTTLRAFINGVQAFSTTNSRNNNTDVPACIGSSFDAQGYSLGYLSNVRVVKGTALYTANFTVPTSPLTAITNTSLLTCQSATLIDNSTNNFTLTRNGDVSVQTLSPFTGTFPTGVTWFDLSASKNNSTLINGPSFNSSNSGSIAFDGTNDYASLATQITGESPISFFAWVYRNDSTTTDMIIGMSGKTSGLAFTTDGRVRFFTQGTTFILDSAASLIANQTWYHVGVTRGATDRIYINAQEVASGTLTQQRSFNINFIGAHNDGTNDPFNGRISNVSVYNRTLSLEEVQQNFNTLRGRYGI